MNAQVTTPAPDDEDMPAEVNFSGGVRGKFLRPGGARLNLPIYLEPQVQAYLSARAHAKGIAYGQLVNDLLKKDIELIEALR